MQMLNRTRNIKNVYIFNNSAKLNKIKYHSLEECKEYFKNYLILDDTFNNMCVNTNEDNETIINENIFFELYTYNEFVKSIYELDKYKYLTEMLKNNGMIINDNENEKIKLSKEDNETLKNKSLNIQYDILNKVIKGELTNEKYNERITFLNLNINDDKMIEKYKDYIIDNNKIENHKTAIKLLKNDLYINDQIKDCKYNKYKINSNDDIGHKIKIFNNVMKKLNLDKFKLDYDDNKDFELDNNDFELLIKQFKMRVNKPKKYYDFKKLHYKLLNELYNGLCSKIQKKKNNIK